MNNKEKSPPKFGVIVERACETGLKSYAQEHLFPPIDAQVGDWWQDKFGYYYPFFHFTARDAAKFGLLYLNDGEYEENQIVSTNWVHDSLQIYSEDAWDYTVSSCFRDIGYGYQWWSARAGEHQSGDQVHQLLTG